jgi:DNA segregation ATPase FtsK/SpoIIIE-like protein
VEEELADLMVVGDAEVEQSVHQLAQNAHAVGVHMIITIQRSSPDVVTSPIKSSFLTRISFRAHSRSESRHILNKPGAKKLLTSGDMLMPNGNDNIMRLHAPFASEGDTQLLLMEYAIGPKLPMTGRAAAVRAYEQGRYPELSVAHFFVSAD